MKRGGVSQEGVMVVVMMMMIVKVLRYKRMDEF